MSPKGGYSEDALVEQPAIALLKTMGWETFNALHEFEVAGGSPLGRDNPGELVLLSRLEPALRKLNPELPDAALDGAVEELLRDRSAMSPAQANREVYELLKQGVKVTHPDPETGAHVTDTVRLVDWDTPANNSFLLVSQFWFAGEMYTRRADLVGFVNGLPLVFIELKAIHKVLKTAYDRNLTDYRDAVPAIFWYNALIILSNGSESRIGSMTAPWEHFAEWKKINDEGEQGVVSLETMLRGTCEPARLLDLVENFTIFQEAKGGLIKLVAKNHQYLGVNNTIRALLTVRERKGRLGVFWHTQGSGKSVSMIFFAQKVLRKLPGNWSFVIVTDRQELDDQIYGEFESARAVTEGHVQADSSAHLRQLLTEDHRYVFTLIHKFRTEGRKRHPALTQRDDVIVIADEAHRTQYDQLALNMRNALPQASFIAFTGTPLIAGEERTREVFGDYVSIYTWSQSNADGATVPLYYEGRLPELHLTNEQLNEDVYRVVDEAELDEAQEAKLARTIAQQYHLITRDDRLEKVAEDLVKHFMGRGFPGKAMVVCIDKATAVRMYDKVQRYWGQYLDDLRRQLATAPEELRSALADDIEFMQSTDMAVVVSQAQNESRDMRKKGVDIKPHRLRMVKENLDGKFKDEDDPFRIVFVCAMWMTGFDVPCCSTIYLDKLMRNHTLMQTMARANRVFREKENGLIVDYVGVFRNLEKALAIYGHGPGGGETPALDKGELVNSLRDAIVQALDFCDAHGVGIEAVKAAEGFERIRLVDDAVEAVLAGGDEVRKRYLSLQSTVAQLYMAILPDPLANEFVADHAALGVIGKKLRPPGEAVDISGVMGAVEQVLDESIEAQGYVIGAASGGAEERGIDLSEIDFEALAERLQRGRKHTIVERLQAAVAMRLAHLVEQNRSRMDLHQRFQEMIEEYNAGSINVEEMFRRLRAFSTELTAEEQRHIAEGLSEEELALFDILTKPEMDLTDDDRKQVKKVARELLETLRGRLLVLDWRKHQNTRAAVRLAIEEELDQLPPAYERPVYQAKCEGVYQHVYEAHLSAGSRPAG